MKTNGDDLVFAEETHSMPFMQEGVHGSGLTKRELFAAMMLSAYLRKGNFDDAEALAVLRAEALIEELNKR
jgi:hypothetical protein